MSAIPAAIAHLRVMRHSIEQFRDSFMPMSCRVIIAVASSARRVCFQMVSQASHLAHSITGQSECHAREPQVGQANTVTTLTHNTAAKDVEQGAGHELPCAGLGELVGLSMVVLGCDCRCRQSVSLSVLRH